MKVGTGAPIESLTEVVYHTSILVWLCHDPVKRYSMHYAWFYIIYNMRVYPPPPPSLV